MPKINKSGHEQSSDSPIGEFVSLAAGEVCVSTNPVFICGVNRKINIGNFENVDVYAGICLPLNNASLEDKDALKTAVQDAATYGFALVSKETGDRYSLIKEAQQNRQ